MIIKNVNIVLKDEIVFGSIFIKDGMISEISVEQSTNEKAIDGKGGYLVAGAIEIHTDNMDLYFTPRPGTQWPSLSAMHAHDSQVISAGITTVCNAIAVGDQKSDGSRMENLKRMVDMVNLFQEKSLGRAEHFLHLRCEVPNEKTFEYFESLMENSLIKLVSLMDHSPGQRQYVKMDEYKKYYKKTYSMNDEEMDKYIAAQKKKGTGVATDNRNKIAAICNEKGITLASHDDATLEHVMESKALNNKIAEFPTTLIAAQESHKNGMAVVMGAPNVVRGGSHSGNLAAHELATHNALDILSSDYFPFSLLEAVFILANDDRNNFTIPQAMALVSCNPATALGLNDRGEIAVNKRADLVLCRFKEGVLLRENVWVKGKIVF